MTTLEERVTVLEQTAVSRIDYINGVNRLMLQMAQNASDTSHELTILLGVTGSQGQDIKILKEDVKALKEDVATLQGDVSDIKKQLEGVDQRLDRLETRANEHTTLLMQILTRLPEKS